MAITISGQGPQVPRIQVTATFGQFQVPGSLFRVRFASTFANANSTGHRELLSELKPMRDRVEASALSDLTALLQRDLNDRRVAKELIPYLMGRAGESASKMSFFPAVLAVLIPKAYLQQSPNDSIAYPITSDDPQGGLATYRSADGAEAWKVERFAASDGELLPVGLLSINTRECEIVVLDGQHRSNAFRYLSGEFDPSGDIYGDFYRDIERPQQFTADLPVTIIWFEASNDQKVEPKLISRQLFVDVNNSANSVSLARTILLDDRSVSALATQAFYNQAAKNSFSADSFSLLHSAFDMDSDLAASAALPPLVLTTPEIVESAFLWLLLGSANYGKIGLWKVERVRAQRNRSQFNQVAGSSDDVRFDADDEENVVQVTTPEAAEAFRKRMQDQVVPALYQLMNGLSFVRSHYAAAKEVETWVSEHGNSTVKEVWKKVFKGGEGLYWTLVAPERRLKTNIYAQATDEVERQFRSARARLLGCTSETADGAYRSFVTKAFQVGFVMSALFLAANGRGGGNVVKAAEDLLARLDSYKVDEWIVLLRELRVLVIGGDATPKVWPSYRNLLVRMYDEGKNDLISNDDLPEWQALKRALNSEADRIADDDAEQPSSRKARQIVTRERDRIAAVFKRAGLEHTWFNSDAVIIIGKTFLKEAIDYRL